MLSQIYFSTIKTNRIKGFTLIELLVVTIIVGLLAAVSTPVLINQIGKARDIELANAVGTFNRSQQAYHWEINKFADGATYTEVFSKLGMDIQTSYASDFEIDTDTDYATIVTVNNNYKNHGTRAYSGGVFPENGLYSLFLCQSLTIEEKIDPPTLTNICDSNIKIK